jgi:hypothetical protein
MYKRSDKMNERIIELAEQSGFQNTKFGLVATNESSAEKFAELIVKECMYAGRQSQINNGLVDADIKQHFG